MTRSRKRLLPHAVGRELATASPSKRRTRSRELGDGSDLKAETLKAEKLKAESLIFTKIKSPAYATAKLHALQTARFPISLAGLPPKKFPVQP